MVWNKEFLKQFLHAFKMRSVNKVLITGGMGFIGSHLARRCLEDHIDVSLLSRSQKRYSNIAEIDHRLNIIIKDVRDISEEDINGIDTIFHLAGSTDNYAIAEGEPDRKSTRLNSSHIPLSRMPSSA